MSVHVIYFVVGIILFAEGIASVNKRLDRIIELLEKERKWKGKE